MRVSKIIVSLALSALMASCGAGVGNKVVKVDLNNLRFTANVTREIVAVSLLSKTLEVSKRIVIDSSIKRIKFLKLGPEGKFFLIAESSEYGLEPWVYDSKNQTTTLLSDISSGTHSSDTSYVYQSEDKDTVLFNANSNVYGYELYEYKFSTNSTRRLTDFNVGAASSNPHHPILVGDKVLVSITNGLEGNCLMEIDLDTLAVTPAPSSGVEHTNTKILAQIDADRFLVESTDDGTYGHELYEYNRSTGVYSFTDNLTSGRAPDLEGLIKVNQKFYFTGVSDADGKEVFEYDPNHAFDKIKPIANYCSGAGNSSPKLLREHNGSLYFVLDSGFCTTICADSTPDSVLVKHDIATGVSQPLSCEFDRVHNYAIGGDSGEYIFMNVDDDLSADRSIVTKTLSDMKLVASRSLYDEYPEWSGEDLRDAGTFVSTSNTR